MSRNWSLSVDDDIDRYANEEACCYCHKCDRKIKHERAYRIYGDIYCAECLEDAFGEDF